MAIYCVFEIETGRFIEVIGDGGVSEGTADQAENIKKAARQKDVDVWVPSVGFQKRNPASTIHKLTQHCTVIKEGDHVVGLRVDTVEVLKKRLSDWLIGGAIRQLHQGEVEEVAWRKLRYRFKRLAPKYPVLREGMRVIRDIMEKNEEAAQNVVTQLIGCLEGGAIEGTNHNDLLEMAGRELR